MKPTLKLTLLLSSFAVATNLSALAGPGPGDWPRNFPTVIKSKQQALECCVPKEKVALACKDCKTVQEKKGEDKKGVMSWFAPDQKHDCSGCGGKLTLRTTGGGKGPLLTQYTHVCTKCGDKSAYTCATHKS
jgi:hypothetical protein